MAGEGPPADVGVGDAAEGLAELDAGADPKPPKPAVPGEGAETVAGVGGPEAVAGVDHHEAELDAGAEAIADIPDVLIQHVGPQLRVRSFRRRGECWRRTNIQL